ncbi:MAG TPA: hypothetical protein VEC16_04530 [Alphaproteobacteria bacterium]|nr:hypothetical protein [Alphaproteobacteria bacterium]
MKNKIGIMGAFFLALTLIVSTFAVSAATVTIRPDGQGAFSAWANVGCGSGSSEWQCVDEVTLNTSDVLSTTTQGAAESFTFGNTGISAATINSVTLYYNAQRSSSSRYQVEPLIVSNGSNYTGGITNLTSAFVLYSKTYTTNPATGVAWTIAEVDALQAGLRASTGTNRGGILAQIYVEVDYTLNNNCSDTDGGNNKGIFGTISGLFGGAPYSFDDVCTGEESITEYYCTGVFANSTNTTCGTDGYIGSNFCSGGDVYRNYANYSCGSGACFNVTAPLLQDDCGAGESCSGGACVYNNTCFDADFGNNIFVASNVTGILNGTGYTHFDVCLNTSVVTEYRCVGGSLGSEPFASNLACNASTTCSLGRCV